MLAELDDGTPPMLMTDAHGVKYACRVHRHAPASAKDAPGSTSVAAVGPLRHSQSSSACHIYPPTMCNPCQRGCCCHSVDHDTR